jgi:hypothetical protein
MPDDKQELVEDEDSGEVDVDGEDDAEAEQEATPAPKADPMVAKVKAWGLTISAVGGLVTGLGGIAGSMSGWFTEPQDNRPVKEAYEVLSEQIEKLNYGVQQNHEDLLALSNWLDGYVTFADRAYTPKPGVQAVRSTVRRPPPAPAPTATAVAHAGAGPGSGTDRDGITDIQDALPAPEAPPEVEPPAPEVFSW